MHRGGATPAGQKGVVLILTLFVILITYALVAQLTLGTSVASQTTRNSALRIRMEAACTSAAQQILETLADDAAAAAGSEAAGAAGEMAGAMGGATGGEESGEGAPEEGADADSWEDTWARPMRVLMGEIEVLAWVQDENSKFNLLALVAEDEIFREESREACARILDRLREGFDDDLSRSDAQRLRDEIVRWLEGRDRDEDYPRPPRYSNPEDESSCAPYSLEELMMLDLVDEELFHDQVREDDELAPGLESVFTVWTSIDLEVPQAGALAGAGTGEEPAAGEAAAAAAAGVEDPALGEGEEGSLEVPVSGGLLGAAQGDPALGAKLNLNTAPRAVLEGVLDDGQIPAQVVEEILEYRNTVDEEALEQRESEEYDPSSAELERAFYGEDQPDPMLFFRSADDLDQLETFATLEATAQQAIRDLVGVKSDVFSVYLFARVAPRDWVQTERYQEPPGPVLRLRAVYWRRTTTDGARFIPIQSWHQVPSTRWRLPDFPDRLPLFEAPRYD